MSGSPFPGMDPYLESDLWTAFHADLAHQIQAQLMPRLRPKYVALIEKRYVIAQSHLLGQGEERVIYPDVDISQARLVKEMSAVLTEAPLVTLPAVEVLNPAVEEVPVSNIEVREVNGRRLVTVIEIFSPTNKQGNGFYEYDYKRASILRTQTHWLELDLLRGGARLPLIGELPPAPYYVFLSRFTHRPRTAVWAVGLRDRLPVVPVPLLPPDPDAPLDVQAAVNACFDLVGYERLLDYTQAPPPPELNAEDAAWLRAQIEAARASL